MNPVAPTPSVPAPTGGAGPAAVAPVAPTTNLPPGLANLTAGAILNGSVVGRDAQGHVLVQTPNGMLSLSTALTLPQGSALSLQIQTMGAQIQMVVLSINQQPQQPGKQAVVTLVPAAQGQPQASRPAPAAPPPPSPAVTVTAGRVLTATVVAEALTPAGAPSADPALPGAPALPGGAAPAAAPPGAAMPHEGPPMLAALLGRLPRDGEPAAPEKGTRLTVRIAALDADPAGDPKAVLRAAAEGRGPTRLLPGTVAEPDAGGFVQVKTPLGVLSLSTQTPLPPASRIVLEIVGEPELPPAPQPQAPVPAQGRGWPALEQAVAVIARAASGAPHVAAALPHPGPDLASALVAALAAIQTGDVRALVGDHFLRALDLAGHHDLAMRLGHEFNQLTTVVPDPSGGAWRSFLIPVHDGAVQFVRFFVRRKRKRSGPDSDPDSTTRFLVEVELSRLGAMQLDGLVKPKKFDLIIRSRTALDPAMRREIAKIFDDALAASGHRGALTFQAGPRFAASPAQGGAPVGVSV